MELMKVWRILLGNRTMIILTTLSATILAVGLTYALPTKYEATAVVLVRPKESMKLSGTSGKDILDFPLSQATPIDAPSKTYMEIIQSRAVAERVVRALALDVPKPKTYDSWWEEWKDILKVHLKDFIRSARHIFKYGKIIELSPFEQAVEDVQENLKMESKKNTYIFLITYGAGNPQEAADVANELAKIFLEYNSQAEKSESMVKRIFLANQLRESEEKLEKARQALKNFKENNLTFSLSEEYSEKLKIVTELESELEKTRIKLAGLLQKYNPSSPEVTKVQAEERQLLASLEERKKDLKTHPFKEKTLEELELEVTAGEANYKFIRTKYEDTILEESKAINDIRIVSQAAPPAYPSKPIKYYYGGSAFIAALVAAIGWAFFRESYSARFRSIDDVNEVLKIKVLATIPKIKI